MRLNITFSVSAIGKETVEGVLRVEERGGANPASYPLVVKRDVPVLDQLSEFAQARGYDAGEISKAIKSAIDGLPDGPDSSSLPSSGEGQAGLPAETVEGEGDTDGSGASEADPS